MHLDRDNHLDPKRDEHHCRRNATFHIGVLGAASAPDKPREAGRVWSSEVDDNMQPEDERVFSNANRSHYPSSEPWER